MTLLNSCLSDKELGLCLNFEFCGKQLNSVLTGNSSPAPQFYGLPKVHKANCPMQPIASACGTGTYQLAKFLTKILKRYTGITPTFVKDSKCFSEYLRTVHISKDKELVSLM